MSKLIIDARNIEPYRLATKDLLATIHRLAIETQDGEVVYTLLLRNGVVCDIRFSRPLFRCLEEWSVVPPVPCEDHKKPLQP